MPINLVIKPLDMKAEGSWTARNRMIDAFCALEAAQETNRWRDWKVAQEGILSLIRPHLRIEGQGTVEEALAQVSAEQFDLLFRSLIGSESVPLASGDSSETPTGDTDAPSPAG